MLMQSKDKGRKVLLVCNDLSRQYKVKRLELELKKSELKSLHTDYEQMIRRKEQDEAKIKKEIAEIALALNMETVKAKNDMIDFRTQVDKGKEKQIKSDLGAEYELQDKIAKTSNYIKSHDMTRRRLSLEDSQEKSQWALRQREANRRIVDTRNNLEHIYQRQRNLNEAAQLAANERQANEIDKKIGDITARRQQLQARMQSERIEKNDEHETLFKTKAAHMFTELEVKTHSDHLKHFQKLVQKDDEVERDLYKSAKEAEFQRRQKDNEVRKLQEAFVELKKQNAQQIKQAIANAYAHETELQQKILREKAKLDKVILVFRFSLRIKTITIKTTTTSVTVPSGPRGHLLEAGQPSREDQGRQVLARQSRERALATHTTCREEQNCYQLLGSKSCT